MPLQNSRYIFSFTAGGLPENFAFDVFLFLTQKHLETQGSGELLFFQLFDTRRKKISVHFPVFLNEGNDGLSPVKAPFGSIQFAREVPPETLAAFINQVQQVLCLEKNCGRLEIKSYPFSYAPEQASLLTHQLIQSGFSVSACDINHHLPVSQASFEHLAYPAAVRRLKKCRNTGLRFKKETSAYLPEAFTFIAACRRMKGYKLSLPLEELECLFRKFPNDFLIFSVKSGKELVACTVAVRVNSQVLYNFLPASTPAFNNLSPAVMLTEGLYNYCSENGFSILDLGTSALPEGPNFPLIAFKKHVGGQPGLKLSFEYQVSNLG